MACPESGMNQALRSKAELKAAYRLFGNQRVDVDEIISSHQVELMKRLEQEKLILAIQDTSLLVYNGHKKTQGLGELGRVYSSGDRGLWLHSCLAVRPDGFPLGLLSHQCWARDRPFDKSDCRSTRRTKRQLMTADEKESIKWVEALEQAVTIAKPSGTRVITIADREADYNVLMGRAVELGAGFVIRSRTNRVIHDYRNQHTTLYQKLEGARVHGTTRITVSKYEGQSNIPVTLKIKFFPFSFRVPDNMKRYQRLTHIWNIHLWAVEAEETASRKADRLHWILLTSEPVRTMEEAKQVIEWYKMRWTVETYFKVLKSGLRVEECRLGSAERLFRYISLMAILGYRVLSLSRISRNFPHEPCREILTEIEWKVLVISTSQSAEATNVPPSIQEAVVMIARLGGYQSRKTDPPPGPIVIWRGLKALNERVHIYEILSGNR